jgi:hypothetical protein
MSAEEESAGQKSMPDFSQRLVRLRRSVCLGSATLSASKRGWFPVEVRDGVYISSDYGLEIPVNAISEVRISKYWKPSNSRISPNPDITR